MKALIFDMDGVYIDSEIHWQEFEPPFLQNLLADWKPEDQVNLTGKGVYGIYNSLVQDFELRVSLEEFLEQYDEIARKVYGKSELIDGALELHNELRNDGIRVGLCTSSPLRWLNIAFERFKLYDAFDTIVSSDHCERKGKPHPDVYLLTAKNLGVGSNEAVAIEDSKAGVEAAKTAGIFCIGLTPPNRGDQDLSNADYQIKSLKELSFSTLEELLSSRSREL